MAPRQQLLSEAHLIIGWRGRGDRVPLSEASFRATVTRPVLDVSKGLDWGQTVDEGCLN
jgi:hypothetical protein